MAKTYTKLQESGKNVEVLFISGDKDEAEFNKYLEEMPWVALPFEDRDRRKRLKEEFKVEVKKGGLHGFSNLLSTCFVRAHPSSSVRSLF